MTFTVPEPFADDLADYLSRGDCPAFDPIPTKPFIEKRVTTLRNPCAVARSKRGIAAIGGGTSLFKFLLNLPRTFPKLIPDLAADINDISSYISLELLSWKNVDFAYIYPAAFFMYTIVLKHEDSVTATIQNNTIPSWVIAEPGDPPQPITSSATMASATAASTQSLRKTCPSNTFLKPTPTAVVYLS